MHCMLGDWEEYDHISHKMYPCGWVGVDRFVHSDSTIRVIPYEVDHASH
jgi:hypothetical protein